MGRHCFLCIVTSTWIQTTNSGVSKIPWSWLQESPMVCCSVSSVAGAAINSMEEDRKLPFQMSVDSGRRMKMLMKRCYVAFLLLLVISAFWITGCKRSQITWIASSFDPIAEFLGTLWVQIQQFHLVPCKVPMKHAMHDPPSMIFSRWVGDEPNKRFLDDSIRVERSVTCQLRPAASTMPTRGRKWVSRTPTPQNKTMMPKSFHIPHCNQQWMRNNTGSMSPSHKLMEMWTIQLQKVDLVGIFGQVGFWGH